MTDVIEIARKRRAELAAELTRLDNFIRMGEMLEQFGDKWGMLADDGAEEDGNAPVPLFEPSPPPAETGDRIAVLRAVPKPAVEIEPTGPDQFLFGDTASPDDVLILSDPLPQDAAAVDIHVGQQLRHRRWMLGMSRHELAEKVGVGAQQIEKYEAGEIHVSTSRLWDIAAALEVTMAYFFEKIDGQAEDTGETRAEVLAGPEELADEDDAPVRTARAS